MYGFSSVHIDITSSPFGEWIIQNSEFIPEQQWKLQQISLRCGGTRRKL